MVAAWVAASPRRMALSVRWGRPLAVGLTLALTVAFLVELRAALSDIGLQIVGLDIGHYLDGTQRWLNTGTPYLPNEVRAPFQYQPLTFLHPPVSMYLFLPFLVLPLALWWAIPLSIVVWSIASWRPAFWSWPILVGALVFSRFHVPLIVGNTDLWVWAGVAAGLRFGWPALVVVVKPSLAPLMFAGAKRAEWWVGAAFVTVACLPFGRLWLDWVAVIHHSPAGVTYSVANLPWLVVPIVAWAARSKRVNSRLIGATSTTS
jgi:hypothetical protein